MDGFGPTTAREGWHPVVLSHRGLVGRHPENTLGAFADGIAAGADGLEFDVHETADGQFIVAHDECWRPGDPPWSALDAGEVRALVGGSGLAPRLEEVLEAFADRPLDIEVKTCRRPARLRAVLRALRPARGSFVSSFDLALLRAFHDAGVDLPLVLVVGLGHGLGAAATLRNLGLRTFPALAPRFLSGLALEARLLTAASLAALRRAGLGSAAWTVDDPVRAARLAREGIGALITDDPAAVRAALDEVSRSR